MRFEFLSNAGDWGLERTAHWILDAFPQRLKPAPFRKSELPWAGVRRLRVRHGIGRGAGEHD